MSSNELDDRLDSWKAIAGYLRRTERTARRWERYEGLPVHRLPHHDRSSVYAFRSELDAWRSKRDAEAAPADRSKATPDPDRRSRLILVVGLVTLIAGLVGYALWPAPDSPAEELPTLGVLPFTVDSADAETEHLGSAVAQSLVNQIARAPDLRVRPFASSMRNYREEEEPAAIGQRMGVDMIVAGQVEARGEDLTIKVTMVDVAANSQIWGSSFATTYGDLGRLQEQVARILWEEASRHRHGTGFPHSEFRTTERLSRNPEAVRHYLRAGGRRSLSHSSMQHVINELHKAVELDPEFAAAHSLLAASYIAYALYGDLPASETYPLAKTHALKAIALDPDSAFARRSLAAAAHWYDFDHAAAERQFHAAIAAAPNEAGTRNWYAEYLIDMRRFDEALVAARASEERDPGWLVPQVNRGNVLLYSGRPEEAILVYRQALEIEPGFGIARHQLAHAYIVMNRFAEAVAEFERANQDIGATPFSMASLAYGLARAGRRAEAEAMLRDFEQRRETGFYPAFVLAKAHVGLGNVEQALDYLEIAVDEKLTGYYLPSVDQVWDPLRGHPRFHRVLQRFGVPDSDDDIET